MLVCLVIGCCVDGNTRLYCTIPASPGHGFHHDRDHLHLITLRSLGLISKSGFVCYPRVSSEWKPDRSSTIGSSFKRIIAHVNNFIQATNCPRLLTRREKQDCSINAIPRVTQRSSLALASTYVQKTTHLTDAQTPPKAYSSAPRTQQRVGRLRSLKSVAGLSFVHHSTYIPLRTFVENAKGWI